MTPRQLFWFEMYAKVGNFTGVHLSKDGVVEYLEIVSVMEALKPSTYRTAKDAKTRVRSAQFDVMTACAAVLLAGQIH
jgi:hypothetical protein